MLHDRYPQYIQTSTVNTRQRQRQPRPPPGGDRYIDDGRGWTARLKSEYMKMAEYNKDLRQQMRKEKEGAEAVAEGE